MYARVGKYEVSPDTADQAIRGFEEQPLEELEGFSGAYLLVDRESGKALTITLWETKEALEKTAERANQMRSQVMESVGGETRSVAHYEVAVSREPARSAT